MQKASFLSLSAAGLLLLAACTTSNTADTVPEGSAMPDASSSSMTLDTNDSSMPTNQEKTSAVSDSATTPASRVINMNVTNWEFSPNAMTAKQGEHIVVHFTGVDGKHSFAIPDLGINVPIEAGETKDIVIPTDKAGTFGFRCMVPCGPGHKEMKGTLTIE